MQSRAEFLELIRTHPVFVSARACGMLGLCLGFVERMEIYGILRGNVMGYIMESIQDDAPQDGLSKYSYKML